MLDKQNLCVGGRQQGPFVHVGIASSKGEQTSERRDAVS
jgi:hypothetical protein